MTEESSLIDTILMRLNPVQANQLQELISEADTATLLRQLRHRRSWAKWKIRWRSMLSRVGLGLVLIVASAGATAAASKIHDAYNAADNATCQPIAVYSQPPAGFDALTASSADLMKYGLPPRPSGDNDGALATWKSMIHGAKYYSAPQPICGTNTHAA